MRFNRFTVSFFIFILIIVTWAFFYILSPYFSAILWAVVLTVIFYPIKNKLQMMLIKHNWLASLFTIIIICLIVFVPLTVIISSLAFEINMLYNKLQCKNTYLPELSDWLFSYLPEWAKLSLLEQNYINVTKVQQRISDVILKIGQYLAGSAFLIGRGTFGFAINFSIMLYLLFSFLKDGPLFVRKILDSLPLSEFTKQHLFAKFVTVARATVKGTVVVAAIHGTMGGIVFYIVSIDSSIFWATIISFLSLVPIIGSAIVWIPVTIYLFAKQQVWQGLFVFCFFILIVGLVDNLLKPLLVGKDTRIPDYLILISTLGGIEIYGINGFVIGPLISALFITCWNLLADCKYSDNTDKII